MAKVSRTTEHEEYYSIFIRIEGKLGTALLFEGEDTDESMKLAERIAEVMDGD